MSKPESFMKTIKSTFLLLCVLLGEYGNIEYHSGLISRPNDEGGAQAIMELRLLKKKKKRQFPI